MSDSERPNVESQVKRFGAHHWVMRRGLHQTRLRPHSASPKSCAAVVEIDPAVTAKLVDCKAAAAHTLIEPNEPLTRNARAGTPANRAADRSCRNSESVVTSRESVTTAKRLKCMRSWSA